MLDIVSVASRNQWEELFNRAAFPHMTQCWEFGEAKRATGWQPKRFVVTDGKDTIAIFQSLTKYHLITRINLGPMMLQGHEDKEPQAYKVVRARYRAWKARPALIAPAAAQSASPWIETFVFKRRGVFTWESSRLDLTKPIDKLRAELDRNWRNKLKQSESNGLTFSLEQSEESRNWIIDREVEHERSKGYSGPGGTFLRSLVAVDPSKFIVGRVLHEGAPIAGIVLYRFRQDCSYYYVGYTADKGRELQAGNFMLWNSVTALKDMGIKTFDLGGHNGTQGFAAFKLGMNGAGYKLAGEFIST